MDNDSVEQDEEPAFPQTYIVIKFSKRIKEKTLSWLVDKIVGKRRDGGAELLARKQPHLPNQGLVLHISATKIKFLEVAEEMEIVKEDRFGIMREFSVNQMEDFMEDGMHVDDLLTTSERQTIVRHELENIRATYDDQHAPGYFNYNLYQGQSIVQVCIRFNLIKKLFPLHDKEQLHKLGQKWYLALFRKQPFEEIREYFGEAVALYFTFLGFYTTALLIPMTLGFLQLIVSTETLAFFCVFNVIWVTVFLEAWKRRCNELAFKWGTIGMTSLDEPRPSYYGEMGIDEVTGRLQPQFPRWKTNAKMYCVSLPIVFLCLVAAFGVMLASFWAEDQLKHKLGPDANSLLIMIPSIMYAALVYLSNLYYRTFATFLTEWENHRTQSQYDRHRVTKLVLFEFVNNFMSLFYIAFVIQDMDMLRHQLATMLIILQAIDNFQEALLPLIIKCYSNKMGQFKKYLFNNSKNLDHYDPLLQSSESELKLLHNIQELNKEDSRIESATEEGNMEAYEGTYDDYLEMFIQFGYVVLFSSVYPMAAFWAVVNNVLEIRADAFKICKVVQRPISRRVKDTGAWQRAFEAVGVISIMTNCGLLCMSPQMHRLRTQMNVSNTEWILMFVVLEHALMIVRQLLYEIIPDKPEWVRVALAKGNYESKRALKKERSQKSRKILSRKFKTVHGPHQHNL